MFKNTLITQITLFHIFKYNNKTREEETPIHSLMFPDMDKKQKKNTSFGFEHLVVHNYFPCQDLHRQCSSTCKSQTKI